MYMETKWYVMDAPTRSVVSCTGVTLDVRGLVVDCESLVHCFILFSVFTFQHVCDALVKV